MNNQRRGRPSTGQPRPSNIRREQMRQASQRARETIRLGVPLRFSAFARDAQTGNYSENTLNFARRSGFSTELAPLWARHILPQGQARTGGTAAIRVRRTGITDQNGQPVRGSERYFTVKADIKKNMNLDEYNRTVRQAIRGFQGNVGSEGYREGEMDEDFEIIGVKMTGGDDIDDLDFEPGSIDDPEFEEYLFDLREDGIVNPDDPLAVARSYYVWQMERGEEMKDDAVYRSFMQENEAFVDRVRSAQNIFRGQFNRGRRTGFHKFLNVQNIESMGMHPLRMRDFNCAYESLMIILYQEVHQDIPPRLQSDWYTYVLVKFNNESFEDQQLILEGCVYELLDFFHRRYNIEVGFINMHHVRDDLLKIEAYEILIAKHPDIKYPPVPKYFLCYYLHHVFPVTREGLNKIDEYVENKLRGKFHLDSEGYMNKIFCVIPPIMLLAYQELWMSIIFPGENYLFKKLGMRYDDIKICSEFVGKKRFNEKSQRQIFGFYKTMSEKSVRQQLAIEHQVYREEKPEEYKVQCETIKKSIEQGKLDQQIVDPRTDQIIIKQLQKFRQQKFENYGVAAVDIETCLDSSGHYSIYNMRPFLCHIYGSLQALTFNKQTNKFVKILKHVDRAFIGYDCMSQLVRWLVVENFCEIETNLKDVKHVAPSAQEHKIENFLWAHNGFSFDWLYMFEPITKELGGFKLIGEPGKTKCFRGNGIALFDFKLIYAERLGNLAKQFFPHQPELWKQNNEDIIDMPPDVCDDLLKYGGHETHDGKKILMSNIREYCRQDCVALYSIVIKFFGDLYCKQLGHSFVSQPFFHSASALAWDVVSRCFLKVPLFINQHTQMIENRMKIGGLTQEYRERCGFGLIMDVNSEYPSVMMNKMPVRYHDFTADAIQPWDGPQVIDKDNYKQFVQRCDIYLIRYKFSSDCKYPTISIRTETTLIQVLDTTDREPIPLYGDSLITAIECDPGCKIFVHSTIKFYADHVFRNYVEYFYAARQEAKQAGDNVNDKFYKMMLNTAFGKFIQKQYKKVMIGSKDEVEDFIAELQMHPHGVDYSVDRLLTEFIPLYQVKYEMPDDSLNHRGALMRIGAFIMEVARNHLMRMKHALVREFGQDCICYCDTDSIVVSFDKVDPVFSKLIDEADHIYQSYKKSGSPYMERSFDILKDLLSNNKYVKRVQELKILDLCNLESGNEVLLIDENRLGAAKIEKFIIRGFFAAPKSYMLDYYADGKITNVIKSKGVQRQYMTKEIFEKIITPRTENYIRLGDGTVAVVDKDFGEYCREMGIENIETIPAPRMVDVVTEKWQRFASGVTKAPIMKVIAPSHKKRLHDLATATSSPFEKVADQLAYAAKQSQVYQDQRYIYNQSIVDSLESIKKGEDYGMLSAGNKRKIQMSNMTKNGMTIQRDLIDESRRRFMMRLPKVRFDHLQDAVVRLALTDNQFIIHVAFFIPKMVSIIEKALFVRKTLSKKKVAEMALSLDTTAKIYAYCLFIHNYLQVVKIPVHPNFTMICAHMSKLVRFYMEDSQVVLSESGSDSEEKSRHRWRFAAEWGLHFLSAPVPLVDYKKLPDSAKPEHYVDFVDLKEVVQVTTLWRVFNNFAEHFKVESLEKFSEHAYDEEQTAMMNRLITESTGSMKFGNGYDFVCELRKQNEQDISNTLLGKRKDHRVEGEDQDIDQNGIIYANEDVEMNGKPDIIFNESDINNLKEREESCKRNFTDILFQMFTQHKNFVTIESEDARNKMIGLVFEQNKFPVSDDKLFKVFGMKIQGEVKVEKTHVVDYCLLFQFFYFGTTDALIIYNRIFAEWSARTDARNIFESQMMTFRIIFQKPSMFPQAKQRRTVPKKLGTLFSKLHKILDINNIDMGMRNENTIQQQLIALACDFDCVTQQLKDLLINVLLNDKDAMNIGKGLTKKLLKWAHPSEAMQNKLKAMLLMQNIPLHPNREEQKREVAKQIYNTESEMADVKPIQLKTEDIFGLDFMDDRFDMWVARDTYAWISSIDNSYQMPASEDPISEVLLEQSPIPQRRYVRATKKFKESVIDESPHGMEQEEMGQTNTQGLKGMYQDIFRHEEDIHMRVFERYANAGSDIEENEKDVDMMLAEMDRKARKRFKTASSFIDAEAVESDNEEEPSEEMFSRYD